MTDAGGKESVFEPPNAIKCIYCYLFIAVYLSLTAIPAHKSSPASAPAGSASDARPGPSGAEGFARIGPPPHPSLSGPTGTDDDNNKLGE